MEVKKSKLGVEIHGFKLNENDCFSNEFKEEVIRLVHEHRIVIFKGQGEISCEKHVEISKWFGELDGTVFEGDPLFGTQKKPHPNVHRISNDPKEGCTNAGRSGWHIDGSFHEAPYAYALYHMPEVPTKGATEFVGFQEVLNSIPAEKREKWERLWMVNDKGDKMAHPLIYKHPITGLSVMCIHLGMTEAFICDKDTPSERTTSKEETNMIIKEITDEIEKNNKELVYVHQWEKGDFILTDNLAVGHFASADSQRPRSEVGLRVLHRTTVKGTIKPSKTRLNSKG